MRIAILDTSKMFGNRSINKDLNGGYGTHDYFGDSIFAKMFSILRGRSVNIPLLTCVYVSTIFKKKGHSVEYCYEKIPQQYFDLFILYGSIVDYKKENYVAGYLRKRNKKSKVGFIGAFPAVMPDLYSNAHFIINGEPEAYFMYQFDSIENLNGMINVNGWMDMDDLPSPDYSMFPFRSYKYSPILNNTPFLTIQSSRGCPYSCGYYCTYPTSQGKKVRYRDPNSLIEDIRFMQTKFSMKSLLFRDPIFGLDKNYPIKLSEKLLENNIKIDWGIETRADLLNKDNLTIMKNAGLSSINIGIETNNIQIAKMNKRKLTEVSHQKEIIEFCNNLGIKIIGFFIIGMEGDTVSSIREMVRFALEQNTFMARFSVSTPYPGTEYYKSLNQKELLSHKNFEDYNQFKLVVNQNNLSSKQIEMLILDAYKRFYFRPRKLYELVSDKVMSVIPKI